MLRRRAQTGRVGILLYLAAASFLLLLLFPLSAYATATQSAPTSTSAPSITGTTTDGATITADTGTWAGPEPTSYTYQWQDCDVTGGNCSDITGATEPSYTALPGDDGARLRVVVTVTNAIGSAIAASPPTSVVVEDQASVATPGLPQYDPALTSDTPVPNLSLAGSQIAEAKQALTGDAHLAQVLQAAGTDVATVLPTIGINSWTNLNGSKLLGASIYIPLPASVTITADWPLMHYDESERTFPPYTTGVERFTAVGVKDLLVTVDSSTNSVVEIQPGPEATIPNPPPGMLFSAPPGQAS